MNRLIFRVLALVTLLASGLTLRAQESAPAKASPEQEKEIRRMMEITGMTKLMNQVVGQMIASFQANWPNVPAETWNELQKELRAEDVIELLVPLYAKYYTAEDLRAINDFYATPAGKRLLEKMPQLTQESMAIGNRWGQEAAARVTKRLESAQPKTN